MKPMLISLRTVITTTIIMIHTYRFANAQLFNTTCFFFNNTGTDELLESCLYNKASPFTVELEDGTLESFGLKSFAFDSCLHSIPQSNKTCTCAVRVGLIYPFETLSECNSCTIQNISDTEFLPIYDCSNLLDGDCVGIDAKGRCINNTGGNVTPAPVRIPTSAPLGTVIPPPAPFPATTAATTSRSTIAGKFFVDSTLFSIGLVMILNQLMG